MKHIRILLLLLLASTGARASTDVGGRITRDMTWTLEGSPYVAIQSVLVEKGATLTIEPGVQVLMSSEKYLRVEGSLVAEGTAAARIRFTSGVYPEQSGDWVGITFGPGAGTLFDSTGTPVGGSILKYVDLQYAEQAVDLASTGLVIDSCHFEQNLSCIRLVNTRHVFIRGNRFQANWGSPIRTGFLPNAEHELYDTRIVGNDIDEERDARIELMQHRISWLEVGFNRIRCAWNALSINGIIPHDVRSVHIHHNLIEAGNNAVSIATSIDRPSPPDQTHVLVEKNILVAIPQHGGIGNQSGLWLASTPSVKIFAAGNTLVGHDNGVVLRGNGRRDVGMNTFVGTARGISTEDGVRLDSIWTTVMFNTFAYNTAEIFRVAPSTYVQYESNDLVQFDNLAFHLLTRDDVRGRENYWGGMSESEAEMRIHDGQDDPALGVVLHTPFAPRAFFSGPLVPPRNVELTKIPGGVVLTWSPSPDRRVGGYRVWYDRLSDGRFASAREFNDTACVILGAFTDPTFAVTAYSDGAKGHLDQLEGRESWFAFARAGGITSVRDEWFAPLKLDLW